MDSQEQSQVYAAIKAMGEGRSQDAVAALNACLQANRTPQALAGPQQRAVAGGISPYHVFQVQGIPAALADAQVRQFQIQWPTIGQNARVIGVMGSVRSGTAADLANVSINLQSNDQENLVVSGRAVKYVPLACLCPVSQPVFSFVTPRRRRGILISNQKPWTGFVVNEGGTGSTITMDLFFLIEADALGQPPTFDPVAYGPRFGVHIIRPDTPAGVPNSAGAGNPSAPSSIYFSSGWANQRITAIIGEVLSAASVQDQSNAAVQIFANGQDQIVTAGPQVGPGFAGFGGLFGNSQGRPERWLALGSRNRYGIDVWPDEQWTLSYQNYGSAAGSIVPVVCMRVEND